MAKVSVDVELSDFEIEDIIQHAFNYVGQLTRKDTLKKLVYLKKMFGLHDIKIESLDDKLKMEHIEKIFTKYTTSYIEQQLPL